MGLMVNFSSILKTPLNIIMTNKEKGNIGLTSAIYNLTKLGYTISLPLNDTQWYDLIAEKDCKTFFVQVKATEYKTKYNFYQCSLKTCGGTSGKIISKVKDYPIDLLFIWTPDGEYLINWKILKNKNSSTINLDRDKNKDWLL